MRGCQGEPSRLEGRNRRFSPRGAERRRGDPGQPRFQKKLWNDNPISKAGRGNINVDSIIGKEEFRKWFVECLKAPTLSRESTKERADALTKLSDDVTNRIKEYDLTKTPHLKIARALAAFYPRDFTTVFDSRMQRDIAKSLGFSTIPRNLKGHRKILQRLEEVLGPAGNDLESVVERMCLPRILDQHQQFVAKKNSDAPNSDEETEQATITRAPLADIQAAIRQAGHFPDELGTPGCGPTSGDTSPC